ncbi:MAG: cell division protein FtsZ [Thermoplasmata archaeon]|nr:cell division protein FtsZ [Thermoplasmata archaeon]
MDKKPMSPDYEDVLVDEELQTMLHDMRISIKIIGLGGAGCNTVARLFDEGIVGAELYAANTDAQHLASLRMPNKILLGKKRTKGLGAGAIPQLGMEAAKEAESEFKAIVENANIVFLTCGLGGGTGTGAIAYVSNMAKELGALTLAFATLPFRGEGKLRMDNAVYGLNRLKGVADTVVTIPNNKLLDIAPRLPLYKAFQMADSVLGNSIKSLTETIMKPGLVNVDLNDIKTVMTNSGAAMIGIGESASSGEQRALEAVNDAINSPLLDADIKSAKGVLVNVTGPTDMSIGESQKIIDLVQTQVSPNAKIIWGANVDPKLDQKHLLRVILVVTGVNPNLPIPEAPQFPGDLVI